MIFEQIILHCFQTIRGERSSSNIYYLLKGKRSIQTVQDAHIYSIDKYYGIYKNITKFNFDYRIQELTENNLLKKENKQEPIYVLTDNGLKWLHGNPCEMFFDGLTYFEKADVFMDRLLLLIQTLTNSKMNFFSFIPVVNNSQVERWVKRVYRTVKGSETKVLMEIFEELQILLKKFTKKEANIFVDRLSGYKTYGFSLFQIGKKYGMTEEDAHLIISSIIHRILGLIEGNQETYPILSKLIVNKSYETQITKSALQTHYYFLRGYSVEQIAKIRRLKENTIYDHLVEIAFYQNDFPIRNYVTNKEENEILHAIKKAKSLRLKNIKNLVDEKISYFQIRLVIAIENKKNKGELSETGFGT